jgi:hypothetical protein
MLSGGLIVVDAASEYRYDLEINHADLGSRDSFVERFRFRPFGDLLKLGISEERFPSLTNLKSEIGPSEVTPAGMTACRDASMSPQWRFSWMPEKYQTSLEALQQTPLDPRNSKARQAVSLSKAERFDTLPVM